MRRALGFLLSLFLSVDGSADPNLRVLQSDPNCPGEASWMTFEGATLGYPVHNMTTSTTAANGDVCWKGLSPEKQRDMTNRGLTKEAWNEHDSTLTTFYSESEHDWEYLSEERKKHWTDRGYDEDKWNTERRNETSILRDNFSLSLQSDPNVAPKVLKLHLYDLDRFNLSYYESLNIAIEVINGQEMYSDEHSSTPMNLKEYITSIREGKTDYKFNIEEYDPDKQSFPEVGIAITENIRQAMISSELGKNGGPFKEEWHNKDHDFFDWSIWMGSKGTRTPTHLDTDLFNFLYVVEGRKRLVVIPKDHRTEGMFPIKEYFSGVAYPGIDILDRSFKLPEGSVDVEVGPGEGILIPFLNWHAVENLENTVAYGFRVMEL